MRIPAYWSNATVEGADREGRKISFSCWRSSDRSEDDAHESALAAAARVIRRISAGLRPPDRYAYGEVPLREAVVERFTGTQGELTAAVTRNSYGSLVLNAPKIMFIDIDFPPISVGERLRHILAKLFSRSVESPKAQRERNAVQRLEQFARENPCWGFRVYRTRAGLRAMATHDLFDPASDATLDVLRSLGTDPLYVRLCKAQECFRARLTPKPWRCGHTQNTTAWPMKSEEQQNRFNKWLAAYESCQAGYGTCRFLAVLGCNTVHSEIEPIIKLHDTITRCHEQRDLA